MELTPDQEQFKANILDFPKQLTTGVIQAGNLDVLQKAASAKKPDSIVFIGMGGSGTPGSILQNIADCAIVDIPVLTWKDAGLPTLPFKNPLYIFISFSGNTREPLDGFNEAIKKGYMVAVVAGGGNLLAEARTKQLPHATFSAGSTLQPRQGYGFTLYAALTIVKTLFPRLEIPDLSAQIDSTQFAVSAEATAARIMAPYHIISTPRQQPETPGARKSDASSTLATARSSDEAAGVSGAVPTGSDPFAQLPRYARSSDIRSNSLASLASEANGSRTRAEDNMVRSQGKTTLVYTTQALSHLGGLFKISICETGKALAFANTIPEINHNELNLIETRPQALYALFITSEAEYQNRKKEFELTSRTLDSYGIPSETIVMPGKTPLEITANAIAAAQWLGLYVAAKQNRNPLGLEVVNKIKDLAKAEGL